MHVISMPIKGVEAQETKIKLHIEVQGEDIDQRTHEWRKEGKIDAKFKNHSNGFPV